MRPDEGLAAAWGANAPDRATGSKARPGDRGSPVHRRASGGRARACVCSTSYGSSLEGNECVWGEGACEDVEGGYTPTHTDAHTHAQQLTAYRQQCRCSESTTAIFGYVVGMMASLIFSRAFWAAQAALL